MLEHGDRRGHQGDDTLTHLNRPASLTAKSVREEYEVVQLTRGETARPRIPAINANVFDRVFYQSATQAAQEIDSILRKQIES